MSARKICLWGDPILKTKCAPVTEVTPEIRALVREMFETLEQENGVGLAANQVGVALRVFVAAMPSKVGPPKTYALINPQATWTSPEKETAEEGCLSFPGLYAPVERHLAFEITGQDLEGRPVTLKGSGLLARAMQHELDHLDGVVFIERLPLMHRLKWNKTLHALAKQGRAAAKAAGR